MGRGESTATVIKGYVRQLSEIYCALLFIVLPLYIPEGYADLGLHKYKLYFAITFVYMVLAVPLSIAGYILERKEASLYGKKTSRFLPVYFVLFYLLICTFSFMISINKHTSLYGYGGWNMGIITQLLMGASFLVAVYAAPGFNKIILFGFVGSSITYIIAILNRFYIYPIKVGMTTSEFISTIGQTNWFCGYMTLFVALAIGLYVAGCKHLSFSNGKFSKVPYIKFLEEKTAIWLLIYLVISFFCMWIQGSDSIFFALGIMLFVIFLVAVGTRESLFRFSVVTAIMGITAEMNYLLIYVLLKGKFFFLQENDIGNNLIRHHVGLLIILFSGICFIICAAGKSRGWNMKVVRAVRVVVTILFIAFVVGIIAMIYLVTTRKEAMGALYNIGFFKFNNKWGTGRGEVWKNCIKSFGLLPFFRKLFGVGISCYYDYIYTDDKFGTIFEVSRGLIVTNAHNMILNLLIETGIMGVVAYLGFYVSAIIMMFRRALNNFRYADVFALAVLACVCGHFANSIFLFQQITATPMILVVLGAYLGLVRNELLL